VWKFSGNRTSSIDGVTILADHQLALQQELGELGLALGAGFADHTS
jgi:hypothetical protein